MAYQRINSSIYTHNGISYESQYDSTNGNTQIIQVNAPTGTQPIFINGSFTASANSVGLSDAAARQTLYNNMQSSVRGAHSTAGGTAKGAVLPTYAQQSNQGKAPSQSSSTPASVPDPNNASGNSSGNIFTDIGSVITNISDPSGLIQKNGITGDNFNKGVGNESVLYAGGMKYPEDMTTESQDHMVIEQFQYIPPSAESIFSGADNIWRNGLARGTDSNKEKIIGQVFLPMPNTVQDSNSASWDADTMNNLSAGSVSDVSQNLPGYGGLALGGGVLGQVAGGNAQGGAEMGVRAGNIAALLRALPGNENLQTLFGTDLVSKILSMQGRGVDVETILARGGGIVPNSNMEFLFKGPTLRSFNNFSWRMTARSEKEAAIIRRILRFFKQGMAPRKISGQSGAPSYMLGTPNVFRLKYLSGGKPIEGLNLFKTCALTTFSTNYTPDGFWAAYDKGQPLSVSISMSFNELEPVYDTDYQESNIFGGRSDLTSVTNSMVGY